MQTPSRLVPVQKTDEKHLPIAMHSMALAFMLAFGSTAWALPTGGAVSAGSAAIATGPGTTTVTQSSQNVAINWQGFSIGAGEAVRFAQPNSASVALNRVLGPDPSSILGSLSANGRVFLVNPNGILFGQGAQVNVGGLVASTRNITDADFMAGNHRFAGTGNGTVVNRGTINAEGGHVALLGASVSNEGTITARLGSVVLAAGNAMTLDLAGDGLLSVHVTEGAVDALAGNGGLIQADGGQVVLTAQAAGTLLQSAVNNTGVIQAQTIENRNGTIRLAGDLRGGTVHAGGTLDASGLRTGQTGGTIVLTGHHVGLFGATVDASGSAGGGTVLVGGGFQGADPAVANAAATYLSPDSRITADAIANGHGGTVVLWANDITRAYGSLSARGGPQGGNGGLIETSGHHLDVAGIAIDAGAPHGAAGRWLIDPADVTIGAGTVGGSFSGNVFSPDSGVNAASIDAGALQAILNGGTDVTITTTNNGTPGAPVSGGDITVTSALTWTTGKALTLLAAHDVIVNAGSAITASTAGSGIVMTAGNDVRINAPLTASALGSRIVLTAGRDVLATAAITASAQDTLIRMDAGRNASSTSAITASGLNAKVDLIAGTNATVNVITANGGGSVDARANVDITVNGLITADAGTVTLRSDSDGSGPGIVGGTVRFPTGSVSAANTVIRFNPAGYVNTTTEIAGFVAKVVAGGADVRAWVFAQGVDKQYDGNNVATLQFRDPLADNPNIGNTVTLNGGTATFDTKDVGVAKPVTFNGFTLGGADQARFTLFSRLGVASGIGTTAARITPAPLTIKANDATKLFGQTLVLSTAAFTLPVPPVAGETVGSVTETSPGTVAIASVGGSPYVITPSSPTGGTFNASNYTITFQTGLLSVTPIVVVPVEPPVIPPLVVPPIVVVVPPADTTPVVTTPVETTPVVTTPVETTPVETTPVVTTPVETLPVATFPGVTAGELTPVEAAGTTPEGVLSGFFPEGTPVQAGPGPLLGVVGQGVRMPPVVVAQAPVAPFVPVVAPAPPVAEVQRAVPPQVPPTDMAPPMRLRKVDRN